MYRWRTIPVEGYTYVLGKVYESSKQQQKQQQQQQKRGRAIRRLGNVVRSVSFSLYLSLVSSRPARFDVATSSSFASPLLCNTRQRCCGCWGNRDERGEGKERWARRNESKREPCRRPGQPEVRGEIRGESGIAQRARTTPNLRSVPGLEK